MILKKPYICPLCHSQLKKLPAKHWVCLAAEKILSLCCLQICICCQKKVFLQREKYDEELEESRLCFLLCSYLQEKSREQGRADLSWLPSGGCCSPMPTPGLDSRAETHSSGRKRQKENLFDVLHFQKEMLLLKWFCGWNHNVSKLGCLGSQALLHQAFFHLPTCLQRQMLPLQPGGANMLFDCKY